MTGDSGIKGITGQHKFTWKMAVKTMLVKTENQGGN